MSPAIVAADYTPQLPAAALALLRVDVGKQKNKKVLRLKQTVPMLYVTLWESLSIESREEVSQHTNFEQTRSQCSVDHHQRDSSHGHSRRWSRSS